jgi:hypothetical protein
LDWACHLARHGVLVVYIVAEGASGIKARIAAWKKHHGVPKLTNLRLMPSNVNLHHMGAVKEFIAAMEAQLVQQPGLVVVDTLARNFVGGNESNPQDMGMFVEGCERIRRHFTTSVLVIHHTTKEGDAERGTEALRNASFAMFKCSRQNQATQAKVVCDRMKEAEQPPDVILRPVKVELPELSEENSAVASLVAGWPYDGDVSGLVSGPGEADQDAKLSRRERRLLKAIVDANQDAKAESLAKRLGVSSTTVSRDRTSLLTRGFLVATGSTRNREYTLSDKGRTAVK